MDIVRLELAAARQCGRVLGITIVAPIGDNNWPLTRYPLSHILLVFLDGVGIGREDAEHNPFASAAMPVLRRLLTGGRALCLATDASLGVPGLPQSATGQATILTGLNVPRLIGKHWGPKPNREVIRIVKRASLFRRLADRGLASALLNAYPPPYLAEIASGHHSYSAVQLAVTAAGLRLFTDEDLRAGRALTADFTGELWRTELGRTDTPIYAPQAAGRKLAALAQTYPFTFFDHWLTDLAGHRGNLDMARQLIERLDTVLGGLVEEWDDETGLIIITSDHGNLEDLSHSHHTLNPVPTILIGAARAEFACGLADLTHFAPRILYALTGQA